MPIQITLNGQARQVPLTAGAVVADLLQHLELKGDRIAVEQNGNILPRSSWSSTGVSDGDRFEIVHFVGGGCHKGRGAPVNWYNNSSHRCP